MPRFMMFMYPVISDEEYAEGPSLEDVEAMTRYNEELTKAGALLAGDGLHPEASRVSAAGVTDGPFSEAKELVGGYWIIQAKDREEAVEWARRVPNPQPGRSATLEVRRVVEAEDLGDAFAPEARAAEERMRARLAELD